MLSKNEVRSALTKYISDHAGDDRLPPLRTISQELGVTIYLRAISGELVQKPEKYTPEIVDKTFLQWQKNYSRRLRK